MRFASLILAIFLLSAPAHASGDLSRIYLGSYDEGYRERIDKFFAGDETMKKKICGITLYWRDYVAEEAGKVHYNDLYHDMDSEEQKAEALALYDIFKRTYDFREKEGSSAPAVMKMCEETAIAWKAYDDKWYLPKRLAAAKADQENWAKLVKDTGPAVWDGVIGGIPFHIPRNHIWFGSNKQDGVLPTLNLIFHAPDMTPQEIPDGPFGKHSDIAGVLSLSTPPLEYPCAGFERKVTCKKTFAISMIMDSSRYCEVGKGGDFQPPAFYRALWRKECRADRSAANTPQPSPVYDNEVEAWGIRNTVFYKGSVEFPDYVMECEKFPQGTESQLSDADARRRCRSAIQLGDRTIFSYSFPRYLFWHHAALQERLKEKILSFSDQRVGNE